MSHYTTLIFDLDGTLLNTLKDLTDAINYVLTKHQYPTRTQEEIRSFIGNGIRKLIERAFPVKLDSNEFEQAFIEFQTYYGVHCRDNTFPYEGVIETLKILHQNRYKIAIMSNKSDDKVQSLKNLFFNNLVDLAIGTKDFSKTKPNPEGTLNIIKHFNSSLEECLFIGDSDVDILTAKNAGIDCISVSWGYKNRIDLQNCGAKIIIDTPKQLLEILVNR